MLPQQYFYPRPPRGGRRIAGVVPVNAELFLSTPSARRATDNRAGNQCAGTISIHALREEGDRTGRAELRPQYYFYPRPPRGGRPASARCCIGRKNFYPRPPRGGRRSCIRTRITRAKFLSTPSARRATVPASSSLIAYTYFYPRPPRGGRRKNLHAIVGIADFYPRPPRGGRPSQYNTSWNAMPFLSTPSARRATRKRSDCRLGHADFYPRPPRGGRPRSVSRCHANASISIHALREEGDLGVPLAGALVLISIHALREEGDL